MKKWLEEMIWPSAPERSAAFLWAGVFGAVWLCISYAGGFLSGWQSRAVSLSSFDSMLFLITARELLRALCCVGLGKIMPKKILTGTIVAIIFAAFALPWADFTALATPYAWCGAVIGEILPILAQSAVLTALVMLGGALPALIYAFLTSALPLLLPLAPVMQRIISLLTEIALPLIFLVILDNDTEQAAPEVSADKAPKKKIPWGMGAFITCLLILSCFFLGVLPWHPTAIASGSMEPELQVGDLVVIKDTANEISVGDIIQFRRDDYNVIHRVAEITEIDGQTVYITKGDANNAPDSGYVRQDDILGTVVGHISRVGWLTLWLHEN